MNDPYRDWLGLTDDRRPPTLYQILGLSISETDPRVIDAAAGRQLAKVHQYLMGPTAKDAWRLIDEITLAKTTLLDPAKRAMYDSLYGFAPAKPTPAAPPPPPAGSPWWQESVPAPAMAAPPPAPPAWQPAPPSPPADSPWWQESVPTPATVAPPPAPPAWQPAPPAAPPAWQPAPPSPAPSAWQPVQPTAPPAWQPMPPTAPPSGPYQPPVYETKLHQPFETAPAPVPFDPMEAHDPPSSDGLSEPMIARPRLPRSNSNLLLMAGGGALALIVVIIIVVAMQSGDSQSTGDDDKKKSTDVVNRTDGHRIVDRANEVKGVKKDTSKDVMLKPPPKKYVPKTPPKNDPPPPPVDMAAEFAQAHIYRGHAATARSLAVAPDGKQLLTVGDDAAVLSWTPGADKPSRRLTLKSEGVGAAFLPSGKEVVVADGGVNYLIELASNKKREFTNPAGGTVALAASSDPRHFLTACTDGQLRWWEISKDAPERTIDLGSNSPINCMALSADGRLAIVGFRNDGLVSVWSVGSGSLVKRWKAHDGDVTAVAFSPDNKRVVTVGQDSLGKVWDSTTGTELHVLKGHTDIPLVASYTADGSLIITGGIDKTIRAWDAATGQLLPWNVPPEEEVFALAMDPRDRFLIAGISKGGVQMLFLPAVRPDLPPKGAWVQAPPVPLPMPLRSEIDLAVKSIRDKYKNDYAQTSPDDRHALFEKLLMRAKVAMETPAARFALFQESRDLAAKLGRIDDAFKAVEARSRWFVADDLEDKALALKAAAQGAISKNVAEAAVAVVEEAEKEGRPDLVDELLREQALFRQFDDAPELGKKIEAAKARWTLSAAERETSRKLATDLKKDPDSPEANAQYGKYLCFRIGAWEDGLPKLAKSDEAALKDLVKRETAPPKDALGQEDLAKAWFDYAPKADDLHKPGILLRAKFWYDTALANNLPLTKKLPVNSKLNEINKQLAAIGNVTLARPGEPVKRRAFNTIRTPLALESQWVFVGTDGVGADGMLLKDNASLGSRFKVLDGCRVEVSFLTDGRPLKATLNGEEMTWKADVGSNIVIAVVERKADEVKFTLKSAIGAVLDEKSVKLAPAKQDPTALTFSVAGSSLADGLRLRTIVVSGMVKPTE